jgi:hypothetical protein
MAAFGMAMNVVEISDQKRTLNHGQTRSNGPKSVTAKQIVVCVVRDGALFGYGNVTWQRIQRGASLELNKC